MVFSNAVFLFIFIPVVVGGYYIFPRKIRNYWLLVSSLLFYAWNKPSFIIILLGSIFLNYLGALFIEKSTTNRGKFWLIVTVTCNLLLLFYFKYFNFTINTLNKYLHAEISFTEVILPIGISFFTFQGLSYVVDVYRRDVSAQHNIFKLALYISMFPQLVAGPIVRYKDIATEIDERNVILEDFAYGTQRFIIGLFKKIIIADTMAVIVNTIFSRNPSLNSMPIAWLGVITYSLQIFFDFSGYSDMAIGLGRMFGFHFLENFDYPYISKNITEFWRRWHISLSSFFRDYVYIPLGGNRKHTFLNVSIVFLLTGIWHGAAFTYIIWGIWHGFFNIAEKYLRTKNIYATSDETLPINSPQRILSAIFQHIYTLLVVMIGWVIFRAPDLKYAISYIMSLFGINNPPICAYSLSYFLDKWTFPILLLGILLSTPLLSNLYTKVKANVSSLILIPIKYCFLLGMLFICILQVASNTYSAFIYFQF